MLGTGFLSSLRRMRLVLGQLLRRLARRGGPRPRPAAPARRLAVEGLEDRQLLSAATWAIPGLPMRFPASHAPYVSFADVNFDGTPDVVISAGRVVQVYVGAPDGSYLLAFQTTRQLGLKSFSLGIGDLNRDGRTDFVTVGRLASGHRSVVNVLEQNRDGSFRSSAQVVNNPAALDTMFAQGDIHASVLWRQNDRPALVAPGSAALSGLLPARVPHAPDENPPENPSPLSENGSTANADDAADRSTPPGARELVARGDHGPDSPRVVLSPDTGALVLRAGDGARGDGASPDTAPAEGTVAVDRLGRPAPDVIAASEAGPQSGAVGPVRRHAAAARAVADGTTSEEASTGLVVPDVALLDMRPRGLGRGGDAATVLAEVRRRATAPAGGPVGTAEPSAPAAEAALRGVKLSVRDLGQILAQAFYLGTLKQAGGSNDSAPGLAEVPGDTRLLVADLVQRTSEVFARVVQGFFTLFLARAALPGEELGWVGMLLGGQTEEQVLSAFLSTAEFGDRANALIPSGTSDERFLRALFTLLLRRTPSDAELGNWLAALPELGRGGVASFLLRSAEFRSLQIASFYEELLQRPATASELESWANCPFDLLTIRKFFEARPDPAPAP